MNIGIASDHSGVEVKQILIDFLQSEGYNVINYGTNDKSSVDYPDYAFKIGEDVSKGKIDRGILLCRTGIGMSIACNKVKGARCGKVCTNEEAIHARCDNNINVIAFSYEMDIEEMKKAINSFLTVPFSSLERHIRRVNKIDNYES